MLRNDSKPTKDEKDSISKENKIYMLIVPEPQPPTHWEQKSIEETNKLFENVILLKKKPCDCRVPTVH